MPKFATVLVSIPASSSTVESEGLADEAVLNKVLYSGEARSQSLSQVIAMAYENGPPFAKMKLKALKPDITRGDSFKLVTARTRDLICPVEGSTGRFAEQKEVNRQVHNMHPAVVRPNVQVVEGAFSSGA
jgi:hypothetical protein